MNGAYTLIFFTGSLNSVFGVHGRLFSFCIEISL